MTTYFPRIGMRMIKTALAVAVCFLIYFLRGEEGVPIFSTIAALICMQPYVEHSVESSVNRIIGTLLGAVFALLVLWGIRYIPWEYRFFRYLIISFAIIPVMYITVLLKKTGASALAGIVLLSVCLSNGGQSPIVDAWNRSIETIVGILVSLGVNSLHLPRRREKDFLFVTGFDGALYNENSGITPYSQFELNQLLHDGLPFTIATERTPASLLADMKELDLQLPVIAMDGAVLVNLKEKRYLACHGLDKELVDSICRYLREKGYHYFLNVVWQDVLLIYHKDFKNEIEREMYEEARRSPYRNYVYGDMPEEGVVVYILLVIKDTEADALEKELCKMDKNQELLYLRDKSETPEEYCHFKIYHKKATKEDMLRRLMEEIPQKKCIAFGSNKNDSSMLAAADVSFATADAIPEVVKAAKYQLRGHDGDSIARQIARLYAPIRGQRVPKVLRDAKNAKNAKKKKEG